MNAQETVMNAASDELMMVEGIEKLFDRFDAKPTTEMVKATLGPAIAYADSSAAGMLAALLIGAEMMDAARVGREPSLMNLALQARVIADRFVDAFLRNPPALRDQRRAGAAGDD